MFIIAFKHHLMSKFWFMTDMPSYHQIFDKTWEDYILDPSIKKFPLLIDAINEMNRMVGNPKFFHDASQVYLYAIDDFSNVEHLVYDRGSYVYIPGRGTSIQTNNQSNQTNQSTATNDQFNPGDALKKYRQGGNVDWVELAKKYGGKF